MSVESARPTDRGGRRRRSRGRSIHGILLLDKPAGISSNRALQQTKKLFDARKAGHTGSLDPLATGMLPICFGEATKVSAFLLDADKGYETTLKLGMATDSYDADGDVLVERPVPTDITRESMQALCDSFLGPQKQVPPMVSAIKVDGKRLYKLAREGKIIERKPRDVNFHRVDVLAFNGDSATLAVHCSKGTYIRSLVNDIGEKLQCGAHVTALRRTFVEPFKGLALHSLQMLETLAVGEGDKRLLPLDTALAHLPVIQLDEPSAISFCHGQNVQIDSSLNVAADNEIGQVRIVDTTEQLLGIAELTQLGEIQPKRVFQW